MLIEEFVARTGYKPTVDEYRKIEDQYYDFDGDKEKFCRQWRENYTRAKFEVQDWLSSQLMDEYENEGKTPKFYYLKNLCLSL